MTQSTQAETDTGILQDDVPWGRRWNWVLGHPEKHGWGAVLFSGLVFTFNGALGVWQLAMWSPGETPQLVSFSIQAALLPLGFTFLWGSMILREARGHQAQRQQHAAAPSSDQSRSAS